MRESAAKRARPLPNAASRRAAPVSPDALNGGGAAGASLHGAFREALASIRRSAGVLAALALFLAIGLAALDDYGVTTDEGTQRYLAIRNLGHVLNAREVLPQDENRFYGAAFESLPMLVDLLFLQPNLELRNKVLLIEQALELEDSRAIYLSRHLLTHLFFLVGGLFVYLLALRLLQSRLLALLAALLFLLHPRLYAHSFFNSKDIPFLVMFGVTLFLAHRAFRREGVGEFALLGAAAGLLMNLRIMGAVLVACVLLARLLDARLAPRAERIRALLGMAAFALAFALTLYATLPALWPSPFIGLIDAWTAFSEHPNRVAQLFDGELLEDGRTPAGFILTWFLITIPPFALPLGIAGAAATLWWSVRRPAAALRNTRLRFALLLSACFALPILAVVVEDSTVFNGWRHLYFLWAPFTLLAAFGLRGLETALRRKRLRVGLYAAAGAGLSLTAVSIALIHPHQQVSFNFLVDRVAPERLRTQYDFDYWGHPIRDALEELLELQPSGPVSVEYGFAYLVEQGALILPPDDRERIVIGGDEPRYSLTNRRRFWGSGALIPEVYAPILRERRVYGNALFALKQFTVDEPFLDDYRTDYEAAAGSDARSEFGVRLVDGGLTYFKEPCGVEDTRRSWFLHVLPRNADDLPRARREHGFDNLDFFFAAYGVLFDGKCIARVPLPSYDIATIRTGQWIRGEGPIWQEELRVDG